MSSCSSVQRRSLQTQRERAWKLVYHRTQRPQTPSDACRFYARSANRCAPGAERAVTKASGSSDHSAGLAYPRPLKRTKAPIVPLCGHPTMSLLTSERSAAEPPRRTCRSPRPRRPRRERQLTAEQARNKQAGDLSVVGHVSGSVDRSRSGTLPQRSRRRTSSFSPPHLR
jgi:hypothetical protein